MDFFSEVNDKLVITSIFRISMSACCSPLPPTIFFLCFTQARPLESLKHCFHSPRKSSLLSILKNLQLETKIFHLVCFFVLEGFWELCWSTSAVEPRGIGKHLFRSKRQITLAAEPAEGKELLRTNSTWWPKISVWFEALLFKVWKTYHPKCQMGNICYPPVRTKRSCTNCASCSPWQKPPTKQFCKR